MRSMPRDGAVGGLRLRVRGVHAGRFGGKSCGWCDVEVQTYVLRQTYVFDGAPTQIIAPTTMIWRRVGGSWKIALFHSIPL